MKIHEICVYSIDKRCMYEESGCDRLHAKCTSQWQVKDGDSWCNLRNFHSKEIEDAFEDVSIDKVKISVLNPAQMGNSAREMIKILGTNTWEVDFDSETLNSLKSPVKSLKIRRLSTQSAAVSKSKKATTYEWYFEDPQKKWVKYSDVDSLKKVHLAVPIKSAEIEENYMKFSTTPMTFSNSRYQYQLDFTTMMQTNQQTGTRRPVRRRPVKKHSAKSVLSGKNEDLPSNWEIMKKTDKLVVVPLDTSNQEYRDVVSRVLLSLPQVRVATVKRIQNPYLWRPYKNKQELLSLSYSGNERLNIQRLFHGTKAKYVDNICRENFDWRLHGTNSGHKYGKGTYFSNRSVQIKFCLKI